MKYDVANPIYVPADPPTPESVASFAKIITKMMQEDVETLANDWRERTRQPGISTAECVQQMRDYGRTLPPI